MTLKALPSFEKTTPTCEAKFQKTRKTAMPEFVKKFAGLLYQTVAQRHNRTQESLPADASGPTGKGAKCRAHCNDTMKEWDHDRVQPSCKLMLMEPQLECRARAAQQRALVETSVSSHYVNGWNPMSQARAEQRKVPSESTIFHIFDVVAAEFFGGKALIFALRQMAVPLSKRKPKQRNATWLD